MRSWERWAQLMVMMMMMMMGQWMSQSSSQLQPLQPAGGAKSSPPPSWEARYLVIICIYRTSQCIRRQHSFHMY